MKKIYEVYSHSYKDIIEAVTSREEAEYILSERYISNPKDVCEIIERITNEQGENSDS